MTIDEQINEYLGRIMHIRELKHANKMIRMRVDVYLDRERSMRYHKTGLVSNEQNIIKRITWNKINQTRTISKSIKQSINRQFTYVGPPPKPVYFCMN